MGKKEKEKSTKNGNMIEEALRIVYSYIYSHYTSEDASIVWAEVSSIIGDIEYTLPVETEHDIYYTYPQIQNLLSSINEKESIRKSKGVYYTPNDVVQFILNSSIKSAYGKLNENTINAADLSMIPYKSFCTSKTIFDPTCGAGEFLLIALEMKMKLLKSNMDTNSKKVVIKTVETIYGNDVNIDSVIITKLRLLLCVAENFDASYCKGVGNVLNQNITSYDFVSGQVKTTKKFNLIVGNPPYVEDSKCGLKLTTKFGNIYANVLLNSAKMLEKSGTIGFIIPLSYVSTPRMRKLREELGTYVPEQYILSFADRPDCLFDSVHQKLCILIAKEKKSPIVLYTGNYQYWYKEERTKLFHDIKVIRNLYYSPDFIPKLGTHIDADIYRKIINVSNTLPVYENSRDGSESVYLNRRETFWMKAYRTKVDDPEYKVFSFSSVQEADFCYCLINSSLFWWYWICVSDCWHVSKTLNGFRMPISINTNEAVALAKALIRRLEETKVYVGTKQTQYEYKHRACLEEIHAIDDYINAAYGLTELESEYIKSFAIRYRTSGGVNTNESN